MDLSLQSRNLNANFNVNSLQSVYKKKNDQNAEIQYNQQQVAPNRTKLINSYLTNDVVLRESHQYDAENNGLPSNKPITINTESAGLKRLENDAAPSPLSMSSLHSAAFFVSDGKKNIISQKPALFTNETEIESGHNVNEIQPNKNKFTEVIGVDSEYSNKLLNQIQCEPSKKFTLHQTHLMQQRPCLTAQVEQKTSNSLMAACKQSTYQYAQSALKSSLILNNQTVFDQALHHLNTCNFLQCPKVDVADIHPLHYIPQHFKQQRNSFEDDDATQMQRSFLQQISIDTAYKANINHITNELLIRKHTISNAKRLSSSSSFNESTNSSVSQDKCDIKQPINTSIDKVLTNQTAAKQASLLTVENANYSKYTKTTEIADNNALDIYKHNCQLSAPSIQKSTAITSDKNDYSSNISCQVENSQRGAISEISAAVVVNDSSKLLANESAKEQSIDCRTEIGHNFRIQNTSIIENMGNEKNETFPNISAPNTNKLVVTNTKTNDEYVLQQQNNDKLAKITNEQNEHKPIAINPVSHKEIHSLANENEGGNSKYQLDLFSSNINTENANSKEIVNSTTCESANLTNSILKKTLETLNNTNVKISSANELNNQQYLSTEISLNNTCTDKPCFEEVENKLEEMFAGIEDEPPIMCQGKNELCQVDKADEGHCQIENLNNTAKILLPREMIDQSYNTRTNAPIGTLTTKAMKKDTDIYSTLSAASAEYPSHETPNKDIESNHDSKSYNNANYTLHNTDTVADIKSNSLDENATVKSNQRKKNLRANNNSKPKFQSRKFSEDSLNSKVITSSPSIKGTLKAKAIKANVHDVCKKKTPNWQNLSTNQDISTISNSQNEKMQRDMESKHRSPFITIKNDGSVTITNATNAEDVNDKYTKMKTCILGRKNIRGLHSSTLSSSYDAEKTDYSWICVFCKYGPHKKGLGDLFGPYVASINCEEYTYALNALANNIQKDNIPHKRKRYEPLNCNDRNLSVITANKKNNFCSSNEMVINQRRKSFGNSRPSQKEYNTSEDAFTNYSNVPDSIECFFGMRKISDESYEVWLHEDCAIWAPDIFLVGSEIIGVGNAVWNSTQYHCSLCLNVGAVVCCLQRECKLLAHVPCAKAAQWLLNEKTLWVYCQKHSKQHNLPSIAYASLSPST